MEDFEQSQKPQMQAVAVISLVLGILCMIFGCMLIGIAFGIASLILAIIYMVKSNGKYLVLVIIGMILSTIGLILSIAMIILVASETDCLRIMRQAMKNCMKRKMIPMQICLLQCLKQVGIFRKPGRTHLMRSMPRN